LGPDNGKSIRDGFATTLGGAKEYGVLPRRLPKWTAVETRLLRTFGEGCWLGTKGKKNFADQGSGMTEGKESRALNSRESVQAETQPTDAEGP